ncbi:MAG: HAMP domain-containing histidine kinase [Deltaproteobacteria bacterium]|nr:HAMP domain-containing histidine kinase [Deltaproteobacteria bacterium]
MILPQLFSIISATFAFVVALLVLVFTRAPGWHNQRRFVYVALSAGLYAISFYIYLVVESSTIIIIFSKIGLLTLATHVVAWSYYADAVLHKHTVRIRHLLVLLCASAAVLVFLPGLVFSDEIRTLAIANRVFVYKSPTPTIYAGIVFLTIACGLVYVGTRFVIAIKRGYPRALLHTLCIVALLLMATNDSLVVYGLLLTPYLLNAGLMLPVGFVAYEIIIHFSKEANALNELRTHLETLVEERTQTLEVSRKALEQTDALATIGRIASSVAHEVNNPAAAILGNIEYLQDAINKSKTIPDDTIECLDDCEKAIRKIATITGQLLDSSHSAIDKKSMSYPVSIMKVINDSVNMLGHQNSSDIKIYIDVSNDFMVLGQSEGLITVLKNIIINSIEAIQRSKKGTCVNITAKRQDNNAFVVIADDGPGMDANTLKHAFEPFFTTNKIGRGVGLGLTVARGLINSMGGSLKIESTLTLGTSVFITLAIAI